MMTEEEIIEWRTKEIERLDALVMSSSQERCKIVINTLNEVLGV